MNTSNLDSFLQRLVSWCRDQPAAEALVLVGSHAGGRARPESDVDLLILTSAPNDLLRDTSWARSFGTVERQAVERWGDVTSLRIWYQEGLEVEFGISTPAWARPPLDAGKAEVVRAGLRVLFDRSGSLRHRLEAARADENPPGAEPAGMC